MRTGDEFSWWVWNGHATWRVWWSKRGWLLNFPTSSPTINPLPPEEEDE